MATTDPNLAALQAQLNANPQLQAILRDPSLLSRDRATRIAALQRTLALPPGYFIGDAGQITKQRPAWVKYLAPAATFAGGVGLSTIGAAAPAIGGSTSAAAPAAGAGAASAGTDAALVDAAATTAPTGGGIVGSSGSIWSRLAPELVGIGANAVGSIIQSRAAGKASAQQQAAAQQALALQQQMFERNQANQAPFVAVGTGAANRLNQLMGLGTLAPAQQPQGTLASLRVAPTAQPLPPNSGGWTGMVPGSPITPMVRMKAPDGSIKPVPPDQVQHYQSMGAQVING